MKLRGIDWEEQRRIFLGDILKDRPTDLPRLIYADWLEDTGHVERAEFIRVQCQLATQSVLSASGCGCVVWGSGSRRHRCERCLLMARQSDLFFANSSLGLDCEGLELLLLDETQFKSQPEQATLILEDGPFWWKTYQWWRGFIRSVSCSLPTWMRVSRILCRYHPVERVLLKDRRPDSYGNYPGWLRTESWGVVSRATCYLPGELWHLLSMPSDDTKGGNPEHADWKTYDSPYDAVNDLSSACLRYGSGENHYEATK